MAGLAVSPLIVLDLHEVSQVSWEKPPGAAVVASLLALTLLGTVGYAALKPGHRRSGPAALAAQPIVRPAVATDDMRAVSQLLSAEARPGDAVVFAALGRRLPRHRPIRSARPAPGGFPDLP